MNKDTTVESEFKKYFVGCGITHCYDINTLDKLMEINMKKFSAERDFLLKGPERLIRRISLYRRARGNVFCDDRARAYHRTLPYPDAGEYYGTCSD